MRITDTILKAKIVQLNAITHVPNNRQFKLSSNGYGVALDKQSNDCGGVDRITETMTKKELAMCIDGMINVLMKINK